LSFIIVTTSCNRVVYSTDYDIKKQGVDFREGKWILAKMDCPSEFYPDLNEAVNNSFIGYLKDRFYSSLPSKSSLLLANKLALNPDQKTLEKLKKESLYDFIINIKAEKISEDAGGTIALTSTENILPKNSVRLTLEVYNLNSLEIVYTKSYYGYTETQRKEKTDINFVKTNKQIIIGCFKKIMKDLDRKSLK
jgi:hypothetical protein